MAVCSKEPGIQYICGNRTAQLLPPPHTLWFVPTAQHYTHVALNDIAPIIVEETSCIHYNCVVQWGQDSVSLGIPFNSIVQWLQNCSLLLWLNEQSKPATDYMNGPNKCSLCYINCKSMAQNDWERSREDLEWPFSPFVVKHEWEDRCAARFNYLRGGPLSLSPSNSLWESLDIRHKRGAF